MQLSCLAIVSALIILSAHADPHQAHQQLAPGGTQSDAGEWKPVRPKFIEEMLGAKDAPPAPPATPIEKVEPRSDPKAKGPAIPPPPVAPPPGANPWGAPRPGPGGMGGAPHYDEFNYPIRLDRPRAMSFNNGLKSAAAAPLLGTFALIGALFLI